MQQAQFNSQAEATFHAQQIQAENESQATAQAAYKLNMMQHDPTF